MHSAPFQAGISSAMLRFSNFDVPTGNVPPIGIADTDKVWPKGKKPRPWPGGHVTIRVGEPFKLADVLPPDLSRKAAKTQATDLIMRRIAALLPERQRGTYA